MELYEQIIGFEIMPKESINITISLKESRDYKVRMWLMRQITRVYFSIMSFLSKGVTKGVIEE